MTLNLQTPFPTFGGSTGGWLRSAEVEEKYAITWTSQKEQIFETCTVYFSDSDTCITYRLQEKARHHIGYRCSTRSRCFVG